MERYKSDQSDMMDRLLRKQLRSSGATQCGGFDPDLAVAYFEKALSSPEEQSYQLHLSECRNCRKLYTEYFLFASESEPELAQGSAAAQTIDIPLNTQAAERKPFFNLDALRAWLFGPQLRWVLPTALVFVVAGTVWFSTNRPTIMKEAAQSAERPYSPAPAVVQSESESNNEKNQPSASGSAQPDAAPGRAEQQPANVLRQFERGGAAAQNAPAQPEPELAKRNADVGKGTKAEEIPADLAAQKNAFAESAKSVGQSKDQSAALRTAPAAVAAQAGPSAPAEPKKEAPKPNAPSAILSDAAENKASGSIQGFILDGAGKSVPGAQLILRDFATGAQKYANADNKGFFSFTGLPSGQYLVQAQTETLRKERTLSLENAQNISNFKLQFDAPPQVALNADELKKKASERDRQQREESAEQEKAKEKKQEGVSGEKTRKPSVGVVKGTASGGSAAGARADKDSAEESEDFVPVDDRWRIGGEARSAKAPVKTDKQARSKSGYNRSETSTVTDSTAVTVKTPAADRKSAKPAIKTKRVGDKNFAFLEGVWTDEEYLLKDKVKDLRVVKLEFKSEAYNKVLNDLPALKPFFQLGEQVTVVYKDAVYIVAKKL